MYALQLCLPPAFPSHREPGWPVKPMVSHHHEDIMVCDFGGKVIKALWFPSCALRSLPLGEAYHCSMRVPKQPCGEVHLVRNQGVLPMAASANFPALQVSYPWKQVVPNHQAFRWHQPIQHIGGPPSWESPGHGSPKFLTHRNLKDHRCLLFFYATKFWDNLLCSHR